MISSFQSLKIEFTLPAQGEEKELFLVADLFLPSIHPKTVLVCWPGGTFTRHYFHLSVPGLPQDTYSFGMEMASRGYLVISFDLLGTGDSSKAIEEQVLTLPVLAQANACVVAHIRQTLCDGTLHPKLEPVESINLVAVGHSMGAQLTVLEQAYSRSYDALYLLGLTHQPIALAGEEEHIAQILGFKDTSGGAMIQETIKSMPKSLQEVRVPFRPLFYAPDVPQEVIDADEALATLIPKGVAIHANNPVFMAESAAQIDVPVFLMNGTIDIANPFCFEPSFYHQCNDITLVELRNSAHCHLLSSSRGLLYTRLDAWLSSLIF